MLATSISDDARCAQFYAEGLAYPGELAAFNGYSPCYLSYTVWRKEANRYAAAQHRLSPPPHPSDRDMRAFYLGAARSFRHNYATV